MENEDNLKTGSRIWFIPDGYLPFEGKTENSGYEGHESLMILNCNDKDADVLLDIFFEDKEPFKDIKLKVPARRIKCFRMDSPESIGGLQIERLSQYAIRVRSNIEIVVQYAKMDVTQENLSYVGMIAYPG